MKTRIVVALISAGACSIASAQSSVTVYGILDAGVQWNEMGVNRGTSSAPNWQSESNVGVDGGYQSGNRFGFRGSEALGGGLNAVFALEGGFNIDTGSSGQGGRLFGRQAWAGLQGSFGTVVAGRIATPSSTTGAYDMFAAADAFDGGWGINAIGSTFIAANALREDNSILYSSPNLAGFKFAGQYSFNLELAETAPQGSNTSAANVSASYSAGPLYLVATYDVISFADSGTARPGAGNADEKLLQIGGAFDFKVVKIYAAYANQTNVSLISGSPGSNSALSGLPIPVGIGNYDNSAYVLGVTVPLFGGRILASYQYSDAKNIDTATAQFEPDYQVWGIGYSYPFSRRTNMYIGYGQRSWEGSIRQTTGGPIDSAAIINRDQFALGLRHLF
ncbi:MAG: porin [Burkholderiaceae bacterium]